MAAQVLAQLQLMHPRRHSWHSSACEIEMGEIAIVNSGCGGARLEIEMQLFCPRVAVFCVRGVEPEESPQGLRPLVLAP